MAKDVFAGIDLAYLKCYDLRLDKGYQRLLDRKRAAAIANGFDARLFGVLIASQREDGYYVIDGQHRHEGFLGAGFGTELVPCLVHSGLSLEQEADLFIRLQNLRKPLTPYDRYRAALVRGDEIPLQVHDILERLGLRAVPSTDRHSEDGLRAVGQALDLVSWHGAALLERILRIVLHAWPADSQTARSSDMLFAITAMINTHAARGRVVDDAQLTSALASRSSDHIMNAVRASKATLPLYKYVAADLALAYNKLGRSPQRRVDELAVGQYDCRRRVTAPDAVEGVA